MIEESARPTLASDEEAEARKLAVEDLSQQHRDVFTRALFNVLFTPASEATFAQIIDGAPLSQNVLNIGDGVYPPTHPNRTKHPELCSGVLDQARQIRSTFDPKDLKFNAPVSQSPLPLFPDLQQYTDIVHSAFPQIPSCVFRFKGLQNLLD